MKVAKDDIEVKMQVPGVIMRQRNTTDLFKGLEGDLCQSPHWGYVISGRITTTDSEGMQETVNKNDLFFWPAGHNVKVEEDAEIIMFSPQHEHNIVIDHLIEKTKA